MHRFLNTENYLLFYYLKFDEMKKLVLLVAVIASVSMFSCTGTQEASTSVDSTKVEDTTMVDSLAAAVDSTVTEAAEAAKDAVKDAAEEAKEEE